jgi:hypothetical protein
MKTIVLCEPLKSKRFLFGSTTIELITIRSPKVRDLVGLDLISPKTLHENMVALASRLSGISEDDLLDMAIPDWRKVTTALGEVVS